jgi:signal transduction histidine kinase/CheY-like chemotaxis protein
MEKAKNSGAFAELKRQLLTGLWLKRIVARVTLILSTLIIITLSLFVFINMPSQRKAILEAMESEARSTVTSIGQVTSSSVISEDFATVIEHCLRVVKESPSIIYVVITRNDGFSLIFTKDSWKQGVLQGEWLPAGSRVSKSSIQKNDISPIKVYHYSYPFQYSSIDWGWIHIGLSLDTFDTNLKAMYLRTFLLALACLLVGCGVALVFARKITNPIFALANTTKLVAQGDLSARADIRTGDELELLGQSFNSMAERLQQSREEIIAEKNKAEAASKAKSQFMAKMSHEIRTPMNGVLGMLGLLKGSPLAAEQLKMIRMAHDSAENLLEVINDILDFSKIEAGKLQLLPIYFKTSDLVNEVMDMYWAKVQDKSVRLVHTIDDSVPAAVKGDAARVRQILINLIGNAIKFTEQGEVSLGLSIAEKTSGHSVLRFEIRDTGSGIPIDKQELIFDPFSQADDSMSRRYEGTGLGLAISKELVEAMGGHIGFQSEVGKGSLFWFTVWVQNAEFIPVDAQMDDTPEEIVARSESEHMPRVLLAEDNLVNQELGKLVLESLDCEVDVVCNGREAVEAVFTKEYDLVLMDCQMPELDGYEATVIIRKRESERTVENRRIYIVALTANAMDGDREHCIAAGMDDYVAKPFKPHQIQTLLGRCCG